jgi:hypothetical protein
MCQSKGFDDFRLFFVQNKLPFGARLVGAGGVGCLVFPSLPLPSFSSHTCFVSTSHFQFQNNTCQSARFSLTATQFLAPQTLTLKTPLNLVDAAMTHLHVHVPVRQAVSNISRHLRLSRIVPKTNQISRTKTTNANAKNTNGKKLTSLDQYSAEKEAAKQHRINLYNAKISRKEGLKTRQDQEKKNHKKKQFRTWFDAMASNQAYLDREARRQGKQWKIKVAAMVERLPVVTPDRPQWELDFLNLKAELGRYDGIAYPKELGFPDPIDDRVLSEQELMGKYYVCYGLVGAIGILY